MRKYVIVLVAGLFLLGRSAGRNVEYYVCTLTEETGSGALTEVKKVGIAETIKERQREIEVVELESTRVYDLSKEDITNLELLVEAEAGGEDYEGKLLVANVVLNRMVSEDFPDTVTEVIFQRNRKVTQFSPVGSGRIYEVTAGEETKKAVQDALEGKDVSKGALYFAARKIAAPKKMQWFDENLTFLFRHGGHDFFR